MKLYRPGVGALVINDQKNVLAGVIPNSAFLSMPQGGIDAAETEEDAVRREVAEEVGLTNLELLAKSTKHLTYDVPEQYRPYERDGKIYVGQRQRWFAFSCSNPDELVTRDDEFAGAVWLPFEELLGRVINFKFALYVQVFLEFRSFLQAHR